MGFLILWNCPCHPKTSINKMKILYNITYMTKNKKSVGVEAAQISPKLSMSLPRLFPDTNALLLLPKNRLFVNKNLKFMDEMRSIRELP